MHAKDWYPLRAGMWIYDVLGAAGGSCAHTRGRTTDHGAAWVDADDHRQRDQFWMTTGNGDIVMTAAIERGDAALVRFDPPLLIAPAVLTPGMHHVSGARMTIVDAANPERQREHGVVQRRIGYVADVVVDTPAGRFDAGRIEVTFTADLQMARAAKHSVMDIVPGIGIVAEHWREEIVVLGTFRRVREGHLVLSDHPH
jgi:hypothetical protein